MAYWRLFYHVVWATAGRAPRMTGDLADRIEGAMRSNCREHNVLIHALTLMPDHIHLAVSIPPSVGIAVFVGRLKGASSHLVNQVMPQADGRFTWQESYGILSFSERALPDVVRYVEQQHRRHESDRLWPSLEQTVEPTSRLQPASFGQPGDQFPGTAGAR